MNRRLILVALSVIVLSGCGSSGGNGKTAQAQELSTTEIPVMTGLLFENFTASDIDGVHSVSCPVDQTVISASCFCNTGAGTVLAVTVAGNAAVCGCSPGIGPEELVDVTARCSKPVMTTVVSSATLQKPLIKNLPDEATSAQWAEEVAEVEAQLHEMRKMR